VVTTRSVLSNDRRAMTVVRLLRRLTRSELLRVVTLMPELSTLPVQISTRESTEDYWRRTLREERGGLRPALDDVFLEGMTYREYFALPEAGQDALWDRIFMEEAWEIEDFEEIDVQPGIPVAAG